MPSPERRLLPLFTIGLAVVAIFGLFAQGQAPPKDVDLGAALTDRVREMIVDQVPLPVSVNVPAIQLSTNGAAIIGGADGRYYMVTRERITVLVDPDTGLDLLWR